MGGCVILPEPPPHPATTIAAPLQCMTTIRLIERKLDRISTPFADTKQPSQSA